MPAVQPGTYRIVNVKSGTCIAVRDHCNAVGWHKEDNKDQQWFVQRSGAGYRFKNCATGQYLCAFETKNSKDRTKVFCGIYPTTWVLRQESKDFEMYMMRLADADRIIDLNKWGSDKDGTELFVDPQPHWVPQQRWRFELLSGETGEEDQKLARELESRDKQIAEKDRELVRINNVLAEKSTLLEQTQAALRQTRESLTALTHESLRNELQKTNQELAQQEHKAESFYDKIQQLELLVSKIVDQTGI